MKFSRHWQAKLDRVDTDKQSLLSGDRRLFEVSSFGTAAILLTIALGAVGAVRAENECGRPEGGAPIVCSTATYDAARDGNILYRITGADGENIVIRFLAGLSIRYDRDNSDDDLPLFPGGSGILSEQPLYSAARIETDGDYMGNISLSSSANVISNGRGISIAHNRKSGALHTEISGGSFSIESTWSLPHAIHSYRGAGYDTDQELSGNHDLVVRNVSIDNNISPDEEWAWSSGIVGFQGGEGDLNVAVQDSAISSNGRWTSDIANIHDGKGNINVDIQESK